MKAKTGKYSSLATVPMTKYANLSELLKVGRVVELSLAGHDAIHAGLAGPLLLGFRNERFQITAVFLVSVDTKCFTGVVLGFTANGILQEWVHARIQTLGNQHVVHTLDCQHHWCDTSVCLRVLRFVIF